MKDIDKKNKGLSPTHDNTPEKQDVEQPDLLEVHDIDMEKGKITKLERSMFVGPIPPPEVLKGYEEVLPGSADRILSLAEKEQAHRHSNEDRIVDNKIENDKGALSYKKRGQYFAAGLALILMGVGVYFGYIDKPEVSKIIFGGTIGCVLIVYVLNKLPLLHSGKNQDKVSE